MSYIRQPLRPGCAYDTKGSTGLTLLARCAMDRVTCAGNGHKRRDKFASAKRYRALAQCSYMN
jgi:hypothetical protein